MHSEGQVLEKNAPGRARWFWRTAYRPDRITKTSASPLQSAGRSGNEYPDRTALSRRVLPLSEDDEQALKAGAAHNSESHLREPELPASSLGNQAESLQTAGPSQESTFSLEFEIPTPRELDLHKNEMSLLAPTQPQLTLTPTHLTPTQPPLDRKVLDRAIRRAVEKPLRDFLYPDGLPRMETFEDALTWYARPALQDIMCSEPSSPEVAKAAKQRVYKRIDGALNVLEKTFQEGRLRQPQSFREDELAARRILGQYLRVLHADFALKQPERAQRYADELSRRKAARAKFVPEPHNVMEPDRHSLPKSVDVGEQNTTIQ